MSALGQYLERRGLATTAISLLREHSEAMRPPRSLWVPFPLGRPLGVPGNPGFQRRVMQALLGLLERPVGPVLEDFPEEAPAGISGGGEAAWACPVSFPAPPPAVDETLADAVRRELRALRPWFEVGRARRGRTTFGISRLPIEEVVGVIERYFEDGMLPDGGSRPDLALKYAIDDLLAYYQEAAASQPGGGDLPGKLTGGGNDIVRWFWSATAAGRLLAAVRGRALEDDDEKVRLVVSRLLVPRGVGAGPEMRAVPT